MKEKSYNVIMKLALSLFGIFLLAVHANAADYPNVILSSSAEIKAYVDGGNGTREDVGDLIITGADVTRQDISSLCDRVKSVNGTLRWKDLTNGTNMDDGISVNHGEPFFTEVDVRGGIEFINCPYLTWVQDIFKTKQKVNGNLIIENIRGAWPGLDGWAATTFFGNLTEVTGDFRIKDNTFGRITANSFTLLERVGGDFELKFGNPYTYTLTTPMLKEIGGDLILEGPEGGSINGTTMQLYSLEGLLNGKLEHIGGSVKIVNFPRLSWGGSGDNAMLPGYCSVRYLIEEGVIDHCKNSIILGWEDEPIDYKSLGGCYDGHTVDDVPVELPKCGQGIGESVASTTVVYPNPVKDELSVETEGIIKKVEIYNLAGDLLSAVSANTSKVEVNVSSLTSGCYLVKVTKENSEVENLKVIK